jgi:pimeloyl-ACP methyl ester carboxylesterase
MLITTSCRQTQKDVPEKTIDVDAGGHNLRMLIVGESGPTVVLESGFGGGIGWKEVRQEVGRFARVVTYDRGGFGASEPGPKPRTARQIAAELRTALGNAGLSPPYILVGHSLGGPYVRVFAATYPEVTAGLVLVDPTHVKT